MTIELVVFDMAGTTVHDGDAVNGCFRAALASAGLRVEPAAVNAVMGLPKPEAIGRLIEACGGTADIASIHRDFIARMQHFYAHDPNVREVPGAAATFAALRRAGIKVALNTGFSRDIVTVLLDRLGWRGPAAVIDASVASDEVPRGRPYPDMVWHLMKQLGISDARRVAKVGDTLVDLEEGNSAGCGVVIGVTTGAATRAQLESRPHTWILDSVAEMPAHLRLSEPEA